MTVEETWSDRLRGESTLPATDGLVPTSSRFLGIAIRMFFDDHGFPHFHARHSEGEAKVRIDNLEVIDSSLSRRQLRFVLAWPSFIRKSSKRTGAGREPVRHFGRSSHCDDRTYS
jgi:Domain of unknown function (DUF4160)